VKRYIQKNIETEIAKKIVKGEVKDGETITIDFKG
jgi:ATP-dependent Clp protease ATP-binding subunit ClpA